MINRALIRLKVVQLVYAHYQNPGKTPAQAEKELNFSLQKAYELYQELLSLLVELRHLALHRIEIQEERGGSVSPQAIYPDKALADNQLLTLLDGNEQLCAYREQHGSIWEDNTAIVRHLYKAIIGSEPYSAYLAEGNFSFDKDQDIIRQTYKTLVCGNEAIAAHLEEHSLYWNDDKDIIDSFVLKTIKRFDVASDGSTPLLPDYDSDADHDFALQLFHTTLQRADEIRELIRESSKNWEFQRLTFMDLIIMQTALAEILTFSTIPLSVSISEYVGIAQAYSTPRSYVYVNGVVDTVAKRLRSEGLLMK